MNIPLETVILKLKAYGISSISDFPFLTSPDLSSLKEFWEELTMFGCLDEQQNITQVGRIISKMSIEPMFGRALVEALLVEHILKNEKDSSDLEAKGRNLVERIIKEVNSKK